MLEFDWDFDNLTHLAEHDIAPEDVEYALTHRTMSIDFQDWHDSEDRCSEVGMTSGGRILIIVTTVRELRLRVVTAYDAPRYHQKEYLQLG